MKRDKGRLSYQTTSNNKLPIKTESHRRNSWWTSTQPCETMRFSTNRI